MLIIIGIMFCSVIQARDQAGKLLANLFDRESKNFENLSINHALSGFRTTFQCLSYVFSLPHAFFSKWC
jgi:hypothetical protein